jgi:hypothetical protein
LYAAVAAILAYLFRQEAEERMRRMHEQRSRETASPADAVPQRTTPANTFGSAGTQEAQ